MCSRVSFTAICIFLTIVSSVSADYIGVTTVNKTDPDTEFLCAEGNGDFVPGPLTVCNVYAAFDEPDDRFLSVGNADLQVYNGAKPDVFFQHPLIPSAYPPPCLDIPDFPDLICDSFVALGPKCYYDSWDFSTDGDFYAAGFHFNGHIVGGWHTSDPSNGQGDAGNYPDLQVLFLQSSVVRGLGLYGDIDVFWQDLDTGEIFAEVDVPVECVAVGGCQDPEDCDDGIPCTEDSCDSGSGQCVAEPNSKLCDDGNVCNGEEYCDPTDGCQPGYSLDCDDGNACNEDGCDPNKGCVHTPIDICDDGNACTEDTCDSDTGCTNTPIDCDDGDLCTDDLCDPDTGCAHEDIECPKGQICDPATGECVEEQDPCECVNGRVTLCHIPPGNLSNARTITVGCAARDKHLAHGDHCGPCEDGGG